MSKLKLWPVLLSFSTMNVLQENVTVCRQTDSASVVSAHLNLTCTAYLLSLACCNLHVNLACTF